MKASATAAGPGHRRRRVDLVGILEAAYRVEQPEEPWLAGVLDAARPGLDDGLGVTAYTYEASNPEDLEVPLRRRSQ